MNDLISIVMPTFNSMATISQTIDSVLKQTYTHWELLVTDDCSQDGTFEYLQKLASVDSRIIPFQLGKNSGAAVARNIGLSRVEGSFIAFIDSDDVWLPKKLEIQLAAMVDDGLDFSFSAYDLIDSGGGALCKIVDGSHRARKRFTYEDMLRKKATLGCSTVMLRASVAEGKQMPLIRTGQDYAFWLSILKTGVDAVVLPEVLTKYRITPNSISRNKFKKACRQWRIYRSLENVSFLRSIELFSHYAYRALFRK